MRFLYLSIGLLLIGFIVFLANYTSNNQNFIIWFGVITAIISPIAFELIFFFFKSKEKVLIKNLSKVPQIEKLIELAKDKEQKIELLNKQKSDLELLISYESIRRTLIAERDIYLIQGKAAIDNILLINDKLEILTKEKQQLPEYLIPLQEEISKIQLDYFKNPYYSSRLLTKNEFPSFVNVITNLFAGIIGSFLVLKEYLDKEEKNKE